MARLLGIHSTMRLLPELCQRKLVPHSYLRFVWFFFNQNRLQLMKQTIRINTFSTWRKVNIQYSLQE